MAKQNKTEAKTRFEFIDPKLKDAGWSIRKPSENIPDKGNFAVEEFDTANGPADYGLFIDGLLVGLVEAKKLSVGPQSVLVQAQRYAKGIRKSSFDFRGFKVPFIYSTNGTLIWFQDFIQDKSMRSIHQRH